MELDQKPLREQERRGEAERKLGEECLSLLSS